MIALLNLISDGLQQIEKTLLIKNYVSNKFLNLLSGFTVWELYLAIFLYLSLISDATIVNSRKLVFEQVVLGTIFKQNLKTKTATKTCTIPILVYGTSKKIHFKIRHSKFKPMCTLVVKQNKINKIKNPKSIKTV